MLRKGDREVLLDLDYGGEAQTTESYGSLQNGVYIPQRYLSAAAADEDMDGDDPIDRHWNTRSNQPVPQPGIYFRDGRTKIDFVLVWEVRSRRKKRGKGKSEATCEEGRPCPPRRPAALSGGRPSWNSGGRSLFRTWRVLDCSWKRRKQRMKRKQYTF
ncbi:unnamed protein product [Pleuronectes platessa]|uniref:Uncharacterized protein n=1 Tax=Pleuronectes platessa TaxID=8262 RepID=A0A9N7YJ33_PLEPL|nr:unnamed protein product [Pleuronectes platessa]